MVLDIIDLQILKLLKENARLKLRDLGFQLNMTPAAIKYRIDQLIESGIIDKFTILINRKKIFEISVYLELYAVSKTNIGIIVNSLKKFPEISKISVLMGNPDLIAEIAVSDMTTIINLLKRISQIEEIQTFKTHFVMDTIQ